MEFKYWLVLSALGLVSGFTVPNPNSDLESSFPQPDARGDAASVGEVTRDKRHLFKKYKSSGSGTVRYQESGIVSSGPSRREIHHHHHYSYPPPPQSGGQYVERHYVETRPVPSQEYHHYHGGYSGGYSSQGSYGGGYSTGGSYYSKPGYGDYGNYYGPPPPSGPVVATPVATGHNSVDRGQGAAAVNNIAIIHARAGSSSNTALEESKILPKPLPVDLDAIAGEALSHHHHYD